MPKLNRNLIRSVAWDVTVISEVANDIMSWNGNIECLSWRYPTQRSDTVDIPSLLQFSTKSPCEYYVLMLELIYDRTHFLFQLLNSFLDLVPEVQQKFALPPYVVKSRHPMLGALVSNFSKRMIFLQQQVIKQAIKDNLKMQDNTGKCNQCLTVSKDIISRGIQTEVKSLLRCENCCLSEALVKHMVIIIEMFGKDFGMATAVSAVRSQMNEELFKITQWSAMQRWTNAITEDLTNFVTRLIELKTKNKDLKNVIEAKDVEYQNHIKQHMAKIKDLENNENQLKLKIKNGEERQSSATSRNKELEMKIALQNVNLENFRKEIKDLESCKCIWEAEKERLINDLNNIEQEVETLHSECKSQRLECNILIEKLKSTEVIKNNQELELIKIKNTLQEKESTFKLQQESYLTESKELNQLVSTQENQIHNLQNIIKQLQGENCKLQEMTSSQQTSIEQLKEKLHTCDEEKLLLLVYPDLNGPLYQNAVQGDPFQDMQHQLQANKLRIQLLKKQNVKLERTLDKMNKLSMAKGDSNIH